jgi:hypothetical protein
MRYYLGIYGYEFTDEISLRELKLIPFTTSRDEAKRLASSQYEFNLTGIVVFTDDYIEKVSDKEFNDLAFDLAGALTFCQHQDVLLTLQPYPSEQIETQYLFQLLSPKLDIRKDRHNKRDILVPTQSEPKANFLMMCLEKLKDVQFNQKTGFRDAFFYNVEIIRLNIRYWQMTYFMTFSALEMLARCEQNDTKTKDAAKVIMPFLKNLQFNVYVDDESGGDRNIRTYVRLRNALFHNGKSEKTFTNKQNQKITLTQGEDGFKLEKLLPDVLLRVMGYGDEYINWDRWIDRNAFKKY